MAAMALLSWCCCIYGSVALVVVLRSRWCCGGSVVCVVVKLWACCSYGRGDVS